MQLFYHIEILEKCSQVATAAVVNSTFMENERGNYFISKSEELTVEISSCDHYIDYKFVFCRYAVATDIYACLRDTVGFKWLWLVNIVPLKIQWAVLNSPWLFSDAHCHQTVGADT